MIAKKQGIQRYGFFILLILSQACNPRAAAQGIAEISNALPRFRLLPTDTFPFNNFVDCNMAEAWIGDTLRVFPGDIEFEK